MTSRSRRIRSLELCDANIFGQIVVTKQTLPMRNPRVRSAVWAHLKPPPIHPDDDPKEYEKRRASVLLDQLLLEIYSNIPSGYSDYNSATSSKSHRASYKDVTSLREQGIEELRASIGGLEGHVVRIGSILVRHLKRRDALRRQRDARCDVISYLLRKRVPEFSPEMRFSIEPLPGDSGFSQWHSAMKMVSQLPEGIPPEFRRRLWLSLAEKHLSSKGIDWPRVERNCFSEWSHPADAELGVQIVKDLHRTGCSLFCGKDGQENQALLKRVLLAYARWNKAVGYCQGFNMLAALILQVTEKCETDALKLMIYLIEGVLPDSYFADSLRGLSVDMAVFRELLRTKLPRLSRHLDTLQVASKEGTTSYEPPLTNVFTMQWFLTLFCNCLPQPTVLRVWDLILLEGNEILLRTALAIWQVLAERIMTAKSADEFYCVMGMLMREILEFDLIDANTLIKGIVTIGPLTELHNLREHYLYNINPWGGSVPAGDADRRMKVYHKDRLVLDIGVLKKQYTKLKQRQRQAHIIFNTAVARQTARPTPVAMNHLLLGKSALVPAKRLGPPKGAIPPARQPVIIPPPQPPKTLHWKDTRRDSSSSSTSSSDTELCDEPDAPSSSTSDDDDDDAKCQLPDDNLTEPSDKTLMTEDNTKQTSASASEDLVDLEAKPDIDNQIEIKSDIFDNSETSSSDLYELNALQRSDSVASEDGFDFEKFLEERVKSFKEKTFSSEESIEDTSEQERLRYARRNSVRALEIIQENSLILHRILQCQSRMTPTPPPTEEEDLSTAGLDEGDATPTNEFTANRELIDCGQIESSVMSRSASLEGIISKYSMISKESDNRSLLGSNESLEEVDYHLEKYRQKLGSPIAEERNVLGAEETKNKESCEKINKYIQNAIDNKGFPKVTKDNYNQSLEKVAATSDEKISNNLKEELISKDENIKSTNLTIVLSKPFDNRSKEFEDFDARGTVYVRRLEKDNVSLLEDTENLIADQDLSTTNTSNLQLAASTQEEFENKSSNVEIASTTNLEDTAKIVNTSAPLSTISVNLQNLINVQVSPQEAEEISDTDKVDLSSDNRISNAKIPETTRKQSEEEDGTPTLITKEEYEIFRAKILEETIPIKIKEGEMSGDTIKRRDLNKDFAILQQSVRELNRSLNYTTNPDEDHLATNSNQTVEDYLPISTNLYSKNKATNDDFCKDFQKPDRSLLNLDSLVTYNFDDDYENEVFVDKLESPKSLKDFSECRRPSLPVVEEELEETVKVNDEFKLEGVDESLNFANQGIDVSVDLELKKQSSGGIDVTIKALEIEEGIDKTQEFFEPSEESAAITSIIEEESPKGYEERTSVVGDEKPRTSYNYHKHFSETKSSILEGKSPTDENKEAANPLHSYNFDFLDELCRKQIAKINEAALSVTEIKQTENEEKDSQTEASSAITLATSSKYKYEEDFPGKCAYKTKSTPADSLIKEKISSDNNQSPLKVRYRISSSPPEESTSQQSKFSLESKDDSSYIYKPTFPERDEFLEESLNKTKYNLESEITEGASTTNTNYRAESPPKVKETSSESPLKTRYTIIVQDEFDELRTSPLHSPEEASKSSPNDKPKQKIYQDESPSKQNQRARYTQPTDGEEGMIEIAKTSKYTSILEYSRNLDERFNNLILKAPGPNLSYSYSLDSEDTPSSSSSLLRSPSIEGQSSPRSPSRSPSHAYNPFPVNISSRQNKEVAVRLGLYKKS